MDRGTSCGLLVHEHFLQPVVHTSWNTRNKKLTVCIQYRNCVGAEYNTKTKSYVKGESGQLPRKRTVCNSQDRQGAGLTASTGMVKQYPL